MPIPNADRAVVDVRKLSEYCLNPMHPEGKHKARMFLAAFNLTSSDAVELRDILLEVVKTNEGYLGRKDEFGQRYTVDFMLDWRGKKALVRSGWIIETGTIEPKLTTCYPW